jgi:hypothetical protein
MSSRSSRPLDLHDPRYFCDICLEIADSGRVACNRFLFDFSPQLTAGSINFRPLPFPNFHAYARAMENVDKPREILIDRAAIRQSLHVVPRNQIDVGFAAGKKPGQFLGVVDAVVEATENNVFVSNLSARLLKKVARGIQYCRNASLIVGGHDPGAERIVWCMQGYGKVVLLAEIREPTNLGRQADCGNGDVSGTDSEPILISSDDQRIEQMIQVCQRFSHTHNDDVG